MKYTSEQKRIHALCRKYKGVDVTFHNEQGCAELFVKEKDGDYYVKTFFKEEYNAIEGWLSAHATPKAVGRPKGSIRPSKRVKRTLSLSKEADEQLNELARQRNESRSAVVNAAIGSLHNIEIMWNEVGGTNEI